MKKGLLLFIMSLFCFSGLAQTPHLNFMGLSMNERLEIFYVQWGLSANTRKTLTVGQYSLR